MNVKILEITPNSIQLLYRAFKTCVSACNPTEIKIPTKKVGSFKGEPVTALDYEKMINLIKRHISHESVLEHVNITFAIEGVSRSLSHQLVRHRVASYSQQSQRYVQIKEFEAIVPSTIKTGNEKIHKIYADCLQNIVHAYNDLIELGVPKEDARYLLPNATTTNLIMTTNLRELRNIYKERSCKYAQEEIRTLVNEMMKLTKVIIPFADYKAKKCGISCFKCVEGE